MIVDKIKTMLLFFSIPLLLFFHQAAQADSPDLSMGARGSDVKEIQQKLRSLGFFKAGITGYYGKITKKAVEDFQANQSLGVTGRVNQKTREALTKESSSKDSAQDSFSVLKVGSRGNEVKEVQEKLKKLNYFKVNTTGYYGSITKSAVLRFQKSQGLTVDGIVGKKTYENLQVAKEKAQEEIPLSSSGFSKNELMLLARAVYSEARDEPYEGQVAVCAVILNRMKTRGFPDTVSGVIFQPRAFSVVKDGRFWGLTPNDTAKKAVQDAVNGWDPANGAVYFFNPRKTKSRYMHKRSAVKRIGTHRFCK